MRKHGPLCFHGCAIIKKEMPAQSPAEEQTMIYHNYEDVHTQAAKLPNSTDPSAK